MPHVLSPDVLADAKGLSLGATAFFLFVGLMLWAFGWRWHQFWVVFAVTVLAGVLGIGYGRAAGVPVLVLAVLIALSAGVLALELAKVAAFFTGGIAAWLGVQAVMPQAQELWAVFLCGGLVGTLLYRLWTMLATSFLGTLLAGHATLLFLETLGVLKGPDFADTYAAAINGWAVTSTLVGVVVQAKTGRTDGGAKGRKAKGGGPAHAPATLSMHKAA